MTFCKDVALDVILDSFPHKERVSTGVWDVALATFSIQMMESIEGVTQPFGAKGDIRKNMPLSGLFQLSNVSIATTVPG
jgi:hypothetical protein